MLQAEHLTKYYGEFKAVDDLTFTVGAEKSTVPSALTGQGSPPCEICVRHGLRLFCRAAGAVWRGWCITVP